MDINTDLDRPLYECDPDKRNDCTKTGCFKYGGDCHMTFHEEYARVDMLGYPVRGSYEIKKG